MEYLVQVSHSQANLIQLSPDCAQVQTVKLLDMAKKLGLQSPNGAPDVPFGRDLHLEGLDLASQPDELGLQIRC